MTNRVLIAVVLLATACQREPKAAETSPLVNENNLLKQKVVRLETESAAKDQYIVDAARTILTVQDQIAPLVGSKMTLIEQAKSFEKQNTHPENQRKQLISDVRNLTAQFATNIAALDKARSDLGRSKVRVVELERVLDGMRRQLVSDQKRMAQLEQDLATANRRVSRLRSDIAKKEATIVDQKKEIETKSTVITQHEAAIETISGEANRVFVIVAPLQVLIDKGVVKPTRHGFLGARKGRALTGKFPPLPDHTVTHDRRTSTIVLPHPFAKLAAITDPGEGVYTMVPTGPAETTITVKDAAKFWAIPYFVFERRP